MKEMIPKCQTSSKRQFIIFLLTGGLAGLINIISRLILSTLIPFEAAILVAYFIGMVVAYILAKQFVFLRSKKALNKSLAAFSLVNLIAVLQTWFISLGVRNAILHIVSSIFIADLISHTVGVIAPVITSFFGHKYISFQDPPL